MTNKFKILAVLMALVMMVSIFTACGKKPAPVEDTPTSSTTESTTEDTAVAPIETDEPETSNKEEVSSTTTTKPSSDVTTTTKPASQKPVSKPETTTKKQNTTTTTTKPSSSGPSYSTFKASTGESVKYQSVSWEGARCTNISETNGQIIATYSDGSTCYVAEKCSNCGKYLCEGCVTEDFSAPCKYCGRTDCKRFLSDVECYGCGKPVKANTCHHCLP